MHVLKQFTLTLAALTGLGIAPLIGQTPSLQTVPLSADIDVVNVRTRFRRNTLRQERKMKFYRRATGSTRLEEANRVVIVDNGAQTVTVLDPISKTAQVQASPMASTTVGCQSRLNSTSSCRSSWAGRTFLRRPISELR